MKVSWVRGVLVLLTLCCLALKANDIVELEQYFNARYSANFLKSTDNVKFVMPPGTKGRISEVKNFNSGNHGLKVELQNGEHKGESVWVYYRPSAPGMKLYSSEEANAETTDVASAKAAETTQDTPALRAPANDKPEIPLVVTKEYAEKMLQQMDKAQKEVKKVETKNIQKPCDEDCKLAKQTYTRDNGVPDPAPVKPKVPAPEKKAEAPKTPAKAPTEKSTPDRIEAVSSAPFAERSSAGSPVMRPPVRTENPFDSVGLNCLGRDEEYELLRCGYAVRGMKEEGFKLYNYGPNRIVPKGNDRERHRKIDFSFIGQARQDIHFTVFDTDGVSRNSQESLFMLFPRETLPTVRIEGGRKIVTLPTGETVSFDLKTNQITGGVLSEVTPSVIGRKPRAIDMGYGGKGVMIQAVAKPGDDPRNISGGQKDVTISKQGKKCVVSKSELWPSQGEHSKFHFKYFSDKDFDAYLKKRCGFSIY